MPRVLRSRRFWFLLAVLTLLLCGSAFLLRTHSARQLTYAKFKLLKKCNTVEEFRTVLGRAPDSVLLNEPVRSLGFSLVRANESATTETAYVWSEGGRSIT